MHGKDFNRRAIESLIKCGAFDLLDTPGTMPPSFDNQYHARHLAYIGSINDDILDMDDVALELLGELAEKEYNNFFQA